VVQRRIVVKAGKKDTLASIARQYKVTEAQIVEWNDLRANARLQPGQAVALMVTSLPQAASRKGGKTRTAKASTGGTSSTTAKAKSNNSASSGTRVAKR
jgi:membrane-bound lytic murein transglycosylase D